MIVTRLCRLISTVALAALLVSPAFPAARPPEIDSRQVLRVCADPNNLPYSNLRGEGFENRIAERIAQELDIPLTYVWQPQVLGMHWQMLSLRLCDLVIGVAGTVDRIQNTNPYYSSIYTLIYRKDSSLAVTSLSSPDLAGKTIGLIEGTPPATLLQMSGVRVNIKPYDLNADTRAHAPAREAVADVAAGRTDAAALWGPLATHYAAQYGDQLVTVPLVDDAKGAVRLAFPITMGLRPHEPEWRRWLNRFLQSHQGEINAILQEYHVPLVGRDGLLVTKAAAAPEPER